MRGRGTSLHPTQLGALAVLHLGCWFALLAHGHHWVGAWLNAVDEVAGSVVIAGPLVSGLVAHAYAQRARSALPDLLVASVHPLRGWYAPALRYLAVAGANLLLLVAEVALLVAVSGPAISWNALEVLPVCMVVLACHVLVGMAIGLRLGPRLAGAVAGTVSFGLFLLSVAHLAPRCLVLGGATEPLVGQHYRLPVLGMLGFLAVLTATAAALATGWTGRWLRTRFLGGIALLLVAMFLGSAGPNLSDRFHPVSVELVCAGTAPQVCLPADAPRTLGSAARGMHRLSGPLRAIGAEVPDRWVDYWGQRPDPHVGMLSLLSAGELAARATDRDLVRSLTMPATCAGFFVPSEPQRAVDVRFLLERWIAFRNGLGPTAGARPWFSSRASEAWVRSTYAALRRCDLGALALPVTSR